MGTDCESLACSPGHVCVSPECNDKVKNGAESDIDCGGATCPKCAVGEDCNHNGDCASGVCTGSPQTCQAPTCTDTVRNGAETDTDCGGPDCPDCANGKDCNGNSDCTSNYCNPSGKCATPSCTDSIKNQNETDVDCGGPTCPDCAIGKDCTAGTDCASGVCTALKCVAPACNDTVENGNETDVDCGGTCPKCAAGKKCDVATDCVGSPGFCTGGICQ